jgi:signal transduction histidine kinase
MANLAVENVRSRSRLFGRLAAVLLFGSGLVSLATLPLPGATPFARRGLVSVAVVAMLVGALAWIAPWDRWRNRVSLVLIPIGLALIAAGNYFGGDADPRSYAIFFVVAFVWVGVAHSQWTSTLLSPVAMAAYVIPILLAGTPPAQAFSSAVFAILICVLVGESLAWGSRHLRRTEAALERERRDAERLRALADLRSMFMTMVSHELRTPVTICRGYLDVLGPDPTSEDIRETAAVVGDELARMGRIIEDITTIVRADDPGFVRPEIMPVGRFVHDVVAKAAPLLGDRLRLTGTPVPEAATVVADQQRMTQALLNLLQNAAVHTNHDSPVDLRAARANGHWRFEVEDRGGGLPARLAPMVFEPFVRGDDGTVGTGLGLAIVRTIATAHGGTVGVRNVPGRGATFWVAIPAGTPAPQAAAPPPGPATSLVEEVRP